MICIGDCNFENGILYNLNRLLRSPAPKMETKMYHQKHDEEPEESMEGSGDASEKDQQTHDEESEESMEGPGLDSEKD